MSRRVWIAFTLATLTAVSLSGCKDKFRPGTYNVIAVQQVTMVNGDEQDRTQLRMKGSASWSFNIDGSFIVDFRGFGVAFDKPCTGDYRGTWEIADNKLRLLMEKSSLRRDCRPERERIILWDEGFGGDMALWAPWEDNLWIVTRLEPAQ